ncbi:MHYT domain-containing protein [Streptomyces sp. NPDC088725]|uniref:MHYT domain-containing protein n=1 Tax=Streptomyces sp. NPDC088725 TaxID=3365873 RepID=UPI0037F41FC7
MQGTVDGFSYGLVTPVAAFLMACLGTALGLRCTARSLRQPHSWKPGGLALGAASIGSGVWTMHFVAMMGFAVAEVPVGYDRLTMAAGLVLGIVMTGIGIFIVGYRGTSPMALVTGGTVTGLAIATMHYVGMAGIRMDGHIEYDTAMVALSVLIAVAAATCALWTVVSHRGFLASLAASLVMALAATGMHYTSMAAVYVHVEPSGGAASGGEPATALLLPMLIGPAFFLLLAGIMMLFDPLMAGGGRQDDEPPVTARDARAGVPAQRTRPRACPRRREGAGRAGAGRAGVGAGGPGSSGFRDR